MISPNHAALNAMLGSSITSLDISFDEYQWAIARYADLGQCLCDFWGSTAGGVIYAQGSIRLGTVTRIVHRDDQYDLDAVCRRDLTKEAISQAELKGDVGDGLEVYVKSGPTGLPYLDDEGRRCWTLGYPGRPFHLDVLPALPDPDEGGNTIILTDRTRLRWQHSNPIDYASWFHLTMATEFIERRAALAKKMHVESVPEQTIKTTLQQAVQALKRHRDIYFHDHLDQRPASVIITTLAARAYRGNGDLYEVIRDIVHRMPDLVEYRGLIPTVTNPVQRKENFAERWSQEPRRAAAFFRWIEQAAVDFNVMGSERGLERVIPKIAAALGDNPASFAAKQLGLGARQLGMTAGLGILASGVGRPVPQHTFRGDR